MTSGMEFIDMGTEDLRVIGVRVSGKLGADAIEELVARIERANPEGREVRLYVDLTGYEGYDLPMVKEKLAHFSTFWSKLDRVAYIVDGGLATLIGLVDAVTPMHMSAFSAEEAEQARSWICEPA